MYSIPKNIEDNSGVFRSCNSKDIQKIVEKNMTQKT